MASRNKSGSSGLVSVDEESARQLQFAVSNASKEVKKALAERLKAAGALVVMEIGKRSPRGATGLLKRSTKATGNPKALSVRVVNTATASSPRYPKYRYGKRLEFDPIYSGRYKFFYPGYEAKKAAAIAELAKVLDDVRDEFLIGGGT